jgi:hypothetical protein
MSKILARQKVNWDNRSIEWTALEQDGGATVSMWSYRVDGLTYFAFPFDPSEDGLDTRTRAVNWLNRYHLILMREHLVLDAGSERSLR